MRCRTPLRVSDPPNSDLPNPTELILTYLTGDHSCSSHDVIVDFFADRGGVFLTHTCRQPVGRNGEVAARVAVLRGSQNTGSCTPA
jgi:hypothetical protein